MATRQALVDLTVGGLAGSSGIIVGQPLDTIKVRLQTHSEFFKGPLDCARQTLKHEGVGGFFKGLSSPLVGSIFNNAIVFCSYGSVLRYMEGDNDSTPSLLSIYFAGTVAGVLQSVAVCPTELVKCRLQVQDGHATTQYKGPIDCVRQVYRLNGLRGLFLGWWPTVWREAPSFGIYFAVYEAMKQKLSCNSTDASASVMLLAGGVAGTVSWASAYPIDVVKSSIQTLPHDARPQERRMVYQAKKIYQRHGHQAFFRGLGTTMFRAFPVNAVTLSMYDWLTTLVNEKI